MKRLFAKDTNLPKLNEHWEVIGTVTDNSLDRMATVLLEIAEKKMKPKNNAGRKWHKNPMCGSPIL
jgi:hypothetical protein